MVVTLSETNNRIADDLFDDSSGYDEDLGMKLAPNLNEIERKQASALWRLFNELWGLLIVKGIPGTGKDVFGNYLSFTLKRYFPFKRIMRDEKPRRLFGPYAGLFNEDVLHEDLARMNELATAAKTLKDKDLAVEKAADDWLSTKGQVMLKNSVLYLTEFWRYCYKREPHKPMNKTMGAIHKLKRHLDAFIIGTVQQESDLDKFTCLPFVDWEVICTRSKVNKTGFTYFVYKTKWDKNTETLETLGSPFPLPVDAGRPRNFIGDGKIVVQKYDYVPVTEEERIILDVLKAGADNYEQLVQFITNEGDMTEDEILYTLKELTFTRSKRAIWYPCYFRIYNSKSAVRV